MQLKMDKKGISPFFTMITGVQAMILIVIIMVIFGVVFIFLASQASVTLTKNENFSTEDIRLLNYLKSPVVLPNEKTTLGELIISSDTDLNKRQILESELQKLLPLSPGIEYENKIDIIRIIFSDNSELEAVEIEEVDTIIASIFLPTEDPAKQVVIRLYSHKP